MCATQEEPSLFRRLILRTAPESSKRAMAIWATWTLAISAFVIAGCIAGRIAATGDVGLGAVAAFTAVTVPLAVLAGVNYRKADGEAISRTENEVQP